MGGNCSNLKRATQSAKSLPPAVTQNSLDPSTGLDRGGEAGRAGAGPRATHLAGVRKQATLWSLLLTWVFQPYARSPPRPALLPTPADSLSPNRKNRGRGWEGPELGSGRADTELRPGAGCSALLAQGDGVDGQQAPELEVLDHGELLQALCEGRSTRVRAALLRPPGTPQPQRLKPVSPGVHRAQEGPSLGAAAPDHPPTQTHPLQDYQTHQRRMRWSGRVGGKRGGSPPPKAKAKKRGSQGTSLGLRGGTGPRGKKNPPSSSLGDSLAQVPAWDKGVSTLESKPENSPRPIFSNFQFFG